MIICYFVCVYGRLIIRYDVTRRQIVFPSVEDAYYSNDQTANDDRTSVACATQRFVSSVTASFEASALVLDCYRCPHP